MIWATSDTELGHKHIIEYCNRPFDSVESMNKIIIGNWNSVVKFNHDVWHLGDFGYGNPEVIAKFFSQLNGRIHILDNRFHHDERWLKSGLEFHSKHFPVIIEPPIVVIKYYKIKFVLCHFPMATWPAKHYNSSIHLHGHSHGNYKGSGKILDVGMDTNNFYPFNLKDILERFSENEDDKTSDNKY